MTDPPNVIDEQPPKPRRPRRLFVTVLRLAVCAAALAYVLASVTLYDHVTRTDGTDVVGTVVQRVDPVVIELPGGQRETIAYQAIAVRDDGQPSITFGLATAWRNSHKWVLLFAIFAHLPVAVFQGIRLRLMLRAQGIDIPVWACIKLSYAGNFLNFAAPLGSTAGDVFKAYFTTLYTPNKTEALTTIVLDRMIGLATLVSVVVIIILLSPADSKVAILRPWMLSMFAVGVLGTLAYFSPHVRRYLVPKSVLNRLPMIDHLRRVDQTACALAKRPMIVAGSVLWTLTLQGFAMTAYILVAIALDLHVGLFNVVEYCAYFYAGAVVQSLPGPPQGLGTVELTYAILFEPYGSPSQIVCMAFLIRLVVLACALPGVLVTMTGSYKPNQVTRDDPPTGTATYLADPQ